MLLKGRNGQEYNLADTPFAGGGEGNIFDIIGQKDLVAKIYHPKHATTEKNSKLNAMVNNPPSTDVLEQIAWPTDILYENSQFVGFTMPRLKCSEELNVMYQYGSPKYPFMTWSNKITIAMNLCVVLNAVHKAGHVIGDFNPRNINVDPQYGRVAFVDTDSYHITDAGQVYRCNVGIPEYIAPEIQKKMTTSLAAAALPTFTPESDNFALAIHIFQLLMNGIHPFAVSVIQSRSSMAFPQPSDNILNGRCPFFNHYQNISIPKFAPDINILTTEVQDLFRLAFVDGIQNPSVRPDAQTWYYALETLLHSVKQCSAVKHHEYLNGLSKCPWCEIDARFSRLSSGSLHQSSFRKPNVTPPPVQPSPSPTPTQTQSSTQKTQTTNTSAYVSHPASNSSNISVSTSMHKKGHFKYVAITILIVILIGIGVFLAKGFKAVSIANNAIEEIPESCTNYLEYDAEINNAKSSYDLVPGPFKAAVRNSERIEMAIAERTIDTVDALALTLPETDDNLMAFKDIILDAHKAYESLNEEQKQRLDYEDRILNAYDKYNHAVVGNLTEKAVSITPELVKTTDILEDIKRNYAALNKDQISILREEDKVMLDELAEAQKIINDIQKLRSDILKNYTMMPAIVDAYNQLSDKQKALIYNHDELLASSSEYRLLKNLRFESYQNGWKIYLNEEQRDTLGETLIIPAYHQNKPIIAIGKNAFTDCKSLTSVIIPDTIKTIEEAAFKGCTNLEYMELPFTGKSRNAEQQEAVLGFIFGYETEKAPSEHYGDRFANDHISENEDGKIWQYSRAYGYKGEGAIKAYYYYIPSSLKRIKLTDQSNIQIGAFNGCESLESITFPISETTVINEAAFQDCKNLTMINSSEEGVFNLGNNIRTIENSAFRNCSDLKTINFPDTLESIGEFAFEGCTGITDIIINDSISEIGIGAFKGCENLSSLTMPFIGNSLEAEEEKAVLGFIFDYEKEETEFGSDSTGFINEYISNKKDTVWQYSNMLGGFSIGILESYYYYIPDSLTEIDITVQTDIPDGAFNGCSNIESINMLKETAKAANIGKCAFQNCTSLKRLNSEIDHVFNLPENIESIGDYAFANCRMTEINLPEDLTFIGPYAFMNCTGIRKLHIPENVSTMSKGSLRGCSNLEQLELPFIGATPDAEGYEAVLGYPFDYVMKKGDYSSYSNGFVNEDMGNINSMTWQYSRAYGSDYLAILEAYYYYLPDSITSISVYAQDSFAPGAFVNCSSLEEIIVPTGSRFDKNSMLGCNATIKAIL